jgi:competence protein ComEC
MMWLYLPLVTGGFITGIVLGAHCSVVSAQAWQVAAMASACASLLFCRGSRFSPHLFLVMAASVACGAAATATRLVGEVPACHVSRHVAGGAGAAEARRRLTATVLAAPVNTRFGQRVLVEAHTLQGKEGISRLCGRVEVRRPPGAQPLWPGEQVVALVRLKPALGSRNPGATGARLRYRRERIGALAFADDRHLLVVNPREPPLLAGLQDRLRAVIDTSVREAVPRAILGALVLGDRQMIEPALRQRFARAGVSHLLAVSGLHLALVAGGVMLLLRWLLLRITWVAVRTDVRRIAGPLAAGVALLYTLITGAAPPTVRACVMVTACLLGWTLCRGADRARPLCLAALVLLVADPLCLFRPGFQLSFTAVIGISLAFSFYRGGTAPASLLRRALRWVRDLAITTTAATLVTAPVVAHHFHQVSVVGLGTNLLAVPWTAFLLLPTALLGTVIGACHGPAGEPLLEAAAWAASMLDRLCQVAGGVDHAALSSGSLGWAATLALCGAALALLTRGSWRRLAAGAGVVLAVVAVVIHLAGKGPPALELSFLDVGQGDSVYVRFPDGFSMLVDGGGSERGDWDPGATRVVPFLRAEGIDRIDLVVASHPHADHVRGLAAVLGEVEVGEVWACWHEEPNRWHDELLRAAEGRGVVVSPPRAFERGGVRLRPIWPPTGGPTCADPGYSANDNSIVLRLEYGRSAVLLTGDVERPVEEALLKRPEVRLRADLLKVPHHGSATSSSSAWIAAVSPRLAVISSGPGNAFGLPDPRVVERYRGAGIELVRIDQLGAVEARLTADGSLSWRPLTGVLP